MPDYTRSTGTNGTMMMRDTGSTIQFWLKSGYPTAWFGSGTFTYTSPHGNGSFTHGYAQGDTWQMMGEITATASGTYSWTIPYSGSNSIGGPTTQSISISRATVPTKPDKPTFSLITHQTVRVSFTSNGNGGSGITDRQISLGPSSGGPTIAGNVIQSNSLTEDFTGLTPGRPLYAWAREKNALGWGAWSDRSTVTPLAGVRIRVGGVWKIAVPYVKVAGIWKAAVPYVRVSGVWKLTTY